MSANNKICLICNLPHTSRDKLSVIRQCFDRAVTYITEHALPLNILRVAVNSAGLVVEVGSRDAELRLQAMMGHSNMVRDHHDMELLSKARPEFFEIELDHALLHELDYKSFCNSLLKKIISDTTISNKLKTCRRYEERVCPGSPLWMSNMSRLHMDMRELSQIKSVMLNAGVNISKVTIRTIRWENNEVANLIYTTDKILKKPDGVIYFLVKADREKITPIGWGVLSYTPSSDNQPVIELVDV